MTPSRADSAAPRLERKLDYRAHPVLFVDDEAENRRVFELTFRREFDVTTAASGEEALEQLHRRPAAVVVSDHRMQGMSGTQLLARVRQLDPGTVRMLVTAFGNAETLGQAINDGQIYRYLAKPWQPDEMRVALRNGIEMFALERERAELMRELETLNRSARELNRELELVPLLDRLLHTLTRELGFDGATVLLFDLTGKRLMPVRSAPRDSDVPARLAQLEIPREKAPEFTDGLLAGRIQRLRNQDLPGLERAVREFATEIAAEEMWVVPLSGHDGVIGALAVDNRRGSRAFSAGDRTLLEGLAAQAVIAIENARLVAELRRSREQVQRADRLGTLGTLAAGLAHEINNPLVSIRTFLTLAPEKRDEDDAEFWDEYHAIAFKEVERIRNLVATMGRLGRSSAQSTPRAGCDLAEVIEDAALLVASTASAGSIELETEVDPELPKVFAVRDQIHQVVLNLALNAIHATPPQGKVRLAARAEPWEGQPAVTLEVSDTGVGIPEEDLERIFDPFFTTKGPDQGSGLGLMICHRIIEDHRGVIEVQSLEGRGATFRVHLPLEPGL